MTIFHVHLHCLAVSDLLGLWFWWGRQWQSLSRNCAFLGGLNWRYEVLSFGVCEKVEVIDPFCFARKHGWGDGEYIIFTEHALET
jgi:hypothetical protein